MGFFLHGVGDVVGSEYAKNPVFLLRRRYGLLGVVPMKFWKILNYSFLDCAWCGEERRVCFIFVCACFW